MEINLRNAEILNTLGTFVNDFYARKTGELRRFHSDGYSPETARERCSEKVLREEYLPNWRDHEGYPVEHCATPIGDLDMKHWGPFWYEWKRDFTDALGANQNTLINYYQGHGMVGWHTNYPSAGYQIVLSWSETGNGAFLYYDTEKDSVVEIPDKPGWQARWYHFGTKESDEKNHCWHAMWTLCDRFTLCYNWPIRTETWDVSSPKHNALKSLMLDCVEELENE